MSSAPLFFFEQTDFSLRLARCPDAQRPLRVDELKEVSIEGATALIASLPPAAIVACAVRPKFRALHLATDDEARKYAGIAGMKKFVEHSSTSGRANTWLAGVQAQDGGPVATLPWLVATASVTHPLVGGTLESLKAKPFRCGSATIATAGALARTALNSVLLIDVGELASHAVLIGREGAMAAGGVSLDLGLIGEAIQTELNLKFRGSAVKLFFNPDYDFSEIGAKIAARLAPAIKSDLARLLVNRDAPSTVFISGLSITQQWFAPQLATALGIPLHIPDLKAWSATTGVTFSNSELSTASSPAWYGLLDFVNASMRTKPPATASWVAEWMELNPASAAIPVPPAAPAPAQRSPVAPVSTAQPSPTQPQLIPVAAVAATSSPIVEPKSEPTPATGAKAPVAATATAATSAPTSSTTPPTAAKYSTSSATSVFGLEPATATPTRTGPPMKPSVTKPAEPAKAVAPKPLVTAAMAKATVPPMPKPFATAERPKPKAQSRNLVAVLAISLGIAGALLGGFYLFNSHNEVTSQLTLEKQAAEQRLKTEQAKARQAEKKAKDEAESRKKTEAEFAQKLSTAEAARRQAEAEAAAQTAARLAAARGSLVVTTNPAGASVQVGTLAPRPSPAIFADLKLGTYPVVISLPHYEDATIEMVVNENATTESGNIELVRLAGGLKISSEPGTATYELHPANTLIETPDSRRSGTTPASIEDLIPGDYSVTLAREGWEPHTQIVSIARNANTVLRWEWPNGLIKITSTPPGATVSRGGTVLGVTPLILNDQVTGEAQFEVSISHYEPVTLKATVEGGRSLELAANFNPEDRYFTLEEVDRKPESIGGKQPDLPYYLTLEGGRAEIELTVNRDGTPTNLTVVQSSSPELGKYCAASIAKWQFKPGIKNGAPVNVRLKLPFAFKAMKQ